MCISLVGCANINDPEPSEYVITKSPFEVPSLYPESDEYLVYLEMCACDDHPKYDPAIYDSLDIYEAMYIYVDGVKTKIDYVETDLNYRNQLNSINYSDENGNLYCFRLDGGLKKYEKNFDYHNSIDYADKISKEDAIRAASEFAAKANDAFDPSKLKVECYESLSYAYDVVFYALGSDNSAQECSRIEVDYREGEVISYQNYSPDYVFYEHDTSHIDFDYITKLFKSRLDEFYHNRLENNFYTGYEFPEKMSVSVLKDGRYCVSCNVIVNLDPNVSLTEVVSMTIICPNNQ